ncbi:DUF4936 family protein [Piscinibacter sp.]|jgi:hypothetical protein|uniref:DUF4936 family protein n=1 Tax=Piscinibacter sp. TaxID=1903157 RepID=UPI002F3FF7C8
MRELFIYYRIPVTNAAAARMRVDAFQARLRDRHRGLVTRLMRRPDATNNQQTWMETYSFERPRQPGDGVTPALQAEIETEALCLAGLVDGERHAEVFIPCAS